MIIELKKGTIMEAYTKKITCPVHATRLGDGINCTATLYMHGHRYAGIWECDATGESDSCEHEDRHTESVESTPTSPFDAIYDSEVYVCDLCECTVEGDPAYDKADMMAELSFDCD